MAEHELIENLRYVHGAYNTGIMLMFFYMARMGLKIRKGRRKGSPDVNVTKRHRRIGPVLAPLGVMGFFFGILIVLLEEGHAFECPLHFLNVLLIAILIVSTFLVSRKIKGLASPWRTLHFVLGIIIVTLYPIQLVLGLGALL
jgi:cytochrome b561